jgi:DNA replicative helicase MCM subunit Mcm2 (Cdc46/Mcm family)
MSADDRAEKLEAENRQQALATPFPRTQSQMLALRRIKARKSINDLFEDAYLVMIETDDIYIRLLDAIYDSQAVEGSLSIDNVKAAERVRNYAIEHNIAALKDEKLATLVKVQGVVVRRYGMDRKHRRQTIGGEVVSNGNDGNDD